MKELVSVVTVVVPVANEATNNGVITALGLEQSVWLGLTFGAWFKLGMAIALVLLIGERATNLYMTWRNRGRHADKNSSNQ